MSSIIALAASSDKFLFFRNCCLADCKVPSSQRGFAGIGFLAL